MWQNIKSMLLLHIKHININSTAQTVTYMKSNSKYFTAATLLMANSFHTFFKGSEIRKSVLVIMTIFSLTKPLVLIVVLKLLRCGRLAML